MGARAFLVVPLVTLLCAACICDIRERRIPNALTLGGALVGLVFQTYAAGPQGLGVALGGWLIGLSSFLLFYMAGAVAAGDVKLMAMVGAFLGPISAVSASLAALLAGSVLGGLFFLLRSLHARAGVDRSVAKMPLQAVRSPDAASDVAFNHLAHVPYGIAISVGAILVILGPQLVQRAMFTGLFS